MRRAAALRLDHEQEGAVNWLVKHIDLSVRVMRFASREAMHNQFHSMDQFQHMGIPVHQGGTLPLDNPNEPSPWEPPAEND